MAINLNKMTIPQLDAYALEKGIDLGGAVTKTEKIALITQSGIEEMINLESMGIRVSVCKSAFNDFEVMEWLGILNDGDFLVYPRLIKRLFGDDWARISEELKGDGSVLPLTRVHDFFIEVMKKVEAKN